MADAADFNQFKIATRETPREILKSDFPSLPELPIRGGWGYDRQTAVVIDRDDPVARDFQPFDGIKIEHVFVEKRLYEELIIFRPKEHRYSAIRRELLDQKTISGDAGKIYDVLRFKVSAIPDALWDSLKADFEGPFGFGSSTFDEAAHARQHEAAKVTFEAEYWFEISSFYGK